jgi:outer membrane protein assembly factor BamE (lipoprotein component of BamABCDE complex)
MMKSLVAVISLILLVGCASYGNKAIMRKDILDNIVVGKSTKAEVKQLLGEPSNVTFSDAGYEDWSYMYVRSTPRATSFIPVVNIVAGGANTNTNTLTLRFNKEGVLTQMGKGQAKGGAGSIFD